MATLLHFLRSLAATLLLSFLLSLSGLALLLGGLMLLSLSPMGLLSDPLYVQVSRFLQAFGRGDRTEGMIAIALTLGTVAAVLFVFSAYKRSQRTEWHLAATKE
ncbi:MAG: Tetraspanin family [Phormidesmis priestleyi Ana]|uniref:Tetraspanin family n=1 Tax=Phormidesmis priestleyi Ana TaxID=1666911 RepID=A0A0P7ZYS0_9CYAN|nr:MAG: Tetraspanin family [Phormidesmis priestleyi Ana]